jgi:hypothetical protein
MKRQLKLLKKITDKLGRKKLDVTLFITYLLRQANNKRDNSKPAVWIDLNANSYVRFSYQLAKYFELEGYEVYFKPNLKFMLSLGAPYSRLLILDKTVKFSNIPPAGTIARFSDTPANTKSTKFISNDYFSSIFEKSKDSYYIPLGMHPNMYHKGLWNIDVEQGEKVRSIFFAGNFDETVYKRLSKNNKFKMLDRVTLGKIVHTMPMANFPKSNQELINNIGPGKIDIVQQSNFVVKMEDLRPIISKYAFFIACPGVDMPLSHNVIEAMSVATIPIIHEEYAKMFEPALEDGINAIIYSDLNFAAKLEEALITPPLEVSVMSKNAVQYYDAHFTPSAIVKNLINPSYNNYYLNAERTSVAIMN